jgi:hypothetical protein
MTGQKPFVEQAVGSYVVDGAVVDGILKGHHLERKADSEKTY